MTCESETLQVGRPVSTVNRIDSDAGALYERPEKRGSFKTKTNSEGRFWRGEKP